MGWFEMTEQEEQLEDDFKEPGEEKETALTTQDDDFKQANTVN